MKNESITMKYVYGRIIWLANDFVVVRDEHSGENVQLTTNGVERDIMKTFKESITPLYYGYFDNHVLACVLGE